MSLFKRHADLNLPDAKELVSNSRNARSIPTVSKDRALRHSAVWACRRLRADLISTLPVDVFRRVDGVQIEVPKPPVFVTPGGDDVDWCEWAYSSQTDLDSCGNSVGIITARDGQGLPRRIELVSFNDVTVVGRGSQITSYRVGSETFDPNMVWHERQYTAPGLPVGLSPIAYAAVSIGGYLTAQEFALDWFMGDGIPRARLKNVAKKIDGEEAQRVKDRFRQTVMNGDLFVHGSDWEYDTIQAKASESAFIDYMKFGAVDVCRFYGVPADMIDAQDGGNSITYANITQRNLQLLIMNLGPAIYRREQVWTRRLLPAPRYVKLNRSALLAMDALSRAQVHQTAINSRTLTPDEARALEDRPPLTPDQIEQFTTLFGSTTAFGGSAPKSDQPEPTDDDEGATP